MPTVRAEEIAYWNSFEQPLTPDAAGKLFLPLEMICLAPSAVNKQPWRMVVMDDVVRFYLQRSKNFDSGKIDMQKIDMGIALCHFELMAIDGTLSEPVKKWSRNLYVSVIVIQFKNYFLAQMS